MIIKSGWTYTSFASTVDCPICESELIDRKCKNGCFEDHEQYLVVFGKIISTYRDNCADILMSEIVHWKKNDRYLMKIMSGE